jgi:uncharacterized protein (TIGR03382 family)
MSFRFQRTTGNLGLNQSDTFQFVTWTGSSWRTIPLRTSLGSFSAAGDFAFSADVMQTVVIPLPTTAALAGLPLLALAFRRRR